MISTIKRCAITPAAINGSDSTIFHGKRRLARQRSLLPLPPSLVAVKNPKPPLLCSSMSRSLRNVSSSIDGAFAFITKPQNNNNALLIACKKAYETGPWQPIIPPDKEEDANARRLDMATYIAMWWGSNVLFNICNKKVLNAFPYPWLTSIFSLAFPSLLRLIALANKTNDTTQPPETDFIVFLSKTDIEFWKTLFPVALAHTIGHLAVTVCMSKAVSFTHIIKGYEPAFSALVSRFLLGENFPLPVYLSLALIASGCTLAAVTDLNFNLAVFMGAMISNLAFVYRNIFSKKHMKGMSVCGANYYCGCLSILSLLILMPYAVAAEGPQLWAAGLQASLSQNGLHFVWWMVAQALLYNHYNLASFAVLNEMSPLTVSIGNTMKRIFVIVSSIIIFCTPVKFINLLGLAIAMVGTSMYTQENQTNGDGNLRD